MEVILEESERSPEGRERADAEADINRGELVEGHCSFSGRQIRI